MSFWVHENHSGLSIVLACHHRSVCLGVGAHVCTYVYVLCVCMCAWYACMRGVYARACVVRMHMCRVRMCAYSMCACGMHVCVWYACECACERPQDKEQSLLLVNDLRLREAHLFSVLREDLSEDDLVLSMHHHLTELARSPRGCGRTACGGTIPLTATGCSLVV